jgi:hypothetical protein
MKFLLFVVYYFLGIFFAFNVACVIGMLFSSVIALINITVSYKNIRLLLFYFLIGAIPAALAWSVFFLVGWIGDRTNYVGQVGLFVGAVFPGVLFLGIIPGFSKIALDHTMGDTGRK